MGIFLVFFMYFCGRFNGFVFLLFVWFWLGWVQLSNVQLKA